jgi:hypothetical protein
VSHPTDTIRVALWRRYTVPKKERTKI